MMCRVVGLPTAKYVGIFTLVFIGGPGVAPRKVRPQVAFMAISYTIRVLLGYK